MPGENSGGDHSRQHAGWLARLRHSLTAPHLAQRAARGFLHFAVITVIMMGVGWVTEKIVNRAEPLELSHVQTKAIAAVEGINPWQIKDRFLCALTPSVASINRKFQAAPAPAAYFIATCPLSSDCAYTISEEELKAVADAEAAHRGETLAAEAAANYRLPQPSPAVGRWADGTSSFAMPFMAFLDTAWHLIVQPSLFGSIFAIFSFVCGGIAAGVAMTLSRGDYPGFVGPLVWCAGTIAATCLVAWGLREVMHGALYLFGEFTRFAGLCCGGATVTYFGYAFSVKALEIKTHAVVEHLVSR